MTTETIPEALEWAASTFGGAEAVVDGETRWSFQELLDEATRIARCLIGSGIERGDKVALWAPNSARWIATSFGVYLAGAVLVPINTSSRAWRRPTSCAARKPDCWREHRRARHRPHGLLEDVGELPELEEMVVLEGPARPDSVAWDSFIARAEGSDGRALPRVGPHDLADIIFTSGTTGAPKGAMLPTGQACAPTRPGAMRWACNKATATCASIPSSTRQG